MVLAEFFRGAGRRAVVSAELGIFEDITALLDFAGTTGRLFVDRPTVDGRVRRLRGRCKIRLFSEVNGHVRLAHTKRLVLSRTYGVVGTCRGLGFSVGGLARGSNNRLHVKTDAAVSRCILPRLVTRFEGRCPSVHLALLDKGSRRVRSTLTTKEVSLNVIRKVGHRPAFGCAPFVGSRLITFMRYSGPLTRRSRVSLRFLGRVPVILHRLNSKALSIVRGTLRRGNVSLSSLGVRVGLKAARNVGRFIRRSLYVNVVDMETVCEDVCRRIFGILRVRSLGVRQRFLFMRGENRATGLRRAFGEFVADNCGM